MLPASEVKHQGSPAAVPDASQDCRRNHRRWPSENKAILFFLSSPKTVVMENRNNAPPCLWWNSTTSFSFCTAPLFSFSFMTPSFMHFHSALSSVCLVALYQRSSAFLCMSVQCMNEFIADSLPSFPSYSSSLQEASLPWSCAELWSEGLIWSSAVSAEPVGRDGVKPF